MNKNIRLSKIQIIGSVGSGKTTLAKKLSTKLKIPYYELDNVVWERLPSGDRRRSEVERNEYLNRIVGSETWIIEGVHYKWVQQGFRDADLIIFIDTDVKVRKYRIIKRFLRQKLGIEHSNYKPTFSMFKKLFVWNSYFENVSKPDILIILDQFNEKVLVFNDTKDMNKYFCEYLERCL
ncbi:AAA family ATPase [Peribacillus acanthi]|uniref:AAA family ATPase n=1 Tax=Peribacillus acanthi TaxID=2171554 RepID=UPI001F0C8766|nr:AAA family ATPase [Peribacillus acanthi]